jgi:cardiolipin synthase
MLHSIHTAQHSIQLESYIFAYDEIGEAFISALTERAAADVNVRVHLDAAGSMFVRAGHHFQQLRKNSVQLHWFHRWSWRKPFKYNRRNHRKLLVVDNRIAFIGGFNIHSESSKRIIGEQRWRDTHLQLSGKLAAHASKLFSHFWQGDHRWLPPTVTDADSQLIPNSTRHCRYQLRCMLEAMFASAQKSIYLTTPYFVPDRHTQRLLQTAAENGIDVRLLVPRKNDIKLARWAAHAAYDELLSSGVQIYEYLPRMLHSKTIIVDGNYATLGTANLDYRSFFINYELNIFTRDTTICEQLQNLFYTDLTVSEKIHTKKWKRRFWAGRILELIGWLARRWL